MKLVNKKTCHFTGFGIFDNILELFLYNNIYINLSTTISYQCKCMLYYFVHKVFKISWGGGAENLHQF